MNNDETRTLPSLRYEKSARNTDEPPVAAQIERETCTTGESSSRTATARKSVKVKLLQGSQTATAAQQQISVASTVHSDIRDIDKGSKKRKVTVQRTIITRSLHKQLLLNANFSTFFKEQLVFRNLKSAKDAIVKRIEKSLANLKSGTMSSSEVLSTELVPEMDNTLRLGPLIPSNQWKYDTPDKQRIKQMDELDFETMTSFEPAVVHCSSHRKTVYMLSQKPLMDLHNIPSGASVPIDEEYMEPICSIRLSPNEFIEGRAEECIDLPSAALTDCKFKRKLESRGKLTWYEEHMRVLATCRPQKSNKINRRSYLHRKCLSFQDTETPTKPSKFRKYSTWEMTTDLSSSHDESDLQAIECIEDDNEPFSFFE